MNDLITAQEAATILGYAADTWSTKLSYTPEVMRICPPVQRKKWCQRKWVRSQVEELRERWQRGGL